MINVLDAENGLPALCRNLPELQAGIVLGRRLKKDIIIGFTISSCVPIKSLENRSAWDAVGARLFALQKLIFRKY